jgi:acetamidase/formamidase
MRVGVVGRRPPEVGERWQLQPRDFHRDSEGRPLGHALVGPVAVRCARPGTVLEVRIDEVRAGARGWTWAGGWWSVLGERLRLPDLDGHLLEWELDGAAGVA